MFTNIGKGYSALPAAVTRPTYFSPFGLESLPSFEDEISNSYDVLSQIAPVVLENQGKGAIGSVVLDKDHPTEDL